MTHPSFLNLPPVPPGGTRLVHGHLDRCRNPVVSYSDGGLRRGRAACAFILRAPSGTALASTIPAVEERSWLLADTLRDSNLPELEALLASAQAALARGYDGWIALTDSYQAAEAVARSVTEAVPPRYPQVTALADLLRRFGYAEIRNLDNRKNREADSLCTARLP